MKQQDKKRLALFLQACAAGFDDIVQHMLTTGGIDLNGTDDNGHSALWHAIHEKHETVARILLQKGGLNLQTIHQAIEEAHKQGLNDLIQVMLDYPNTMHNSPREQTDILLNACRTLNGFNFDILTAAIKMKNFTLAEKIIDSADISIDMNADFTPLVSAIECNAVSLVKKMLAKPNTDVNACGLSELPPLLAAVEYPEIVELLLARKDLYVRCKDGGCNTALILAVRAKAFATVKLLVKHGGIDINTVSKDASCFLIPKCKEYLTGVPAEGVCLYGAQTMFGHRFSWNDYAKCGLTALQTAVVLGYEDIALYLINEAGARTDIPLPGDIPLFFEAIRQKEEAVAAVLLQKLPFKLLNTAIPDPECPKHKITALHVAFRARAINIFRMLLLLPIDVNRGEFSEVRGDVVHDTILGEVFYVHRHKEKVWDYLEALFARPDADVHICTESPIDNRTVFQIMTDEKSELLELLPENVRKGLEKSKRDHTYYY